MRTSSLTGMARRLAKGIFTSEVLITREGAEVWNEVTGQYEPSLVTVYSDIARVQTDQPYEQKPDAAGQSYVVTRSVLQVPVEVAGILPGDLVTVTKERKDPDLVGKKFTVASEHVETDASMRRVPLERQA